MATDYLGASALPIALVDLSSFGDRHKTFAQADPLVWAAPVSAFLARVVGR